MNRRWYYLGLAIVAASVPFHQPLLIVIGFLVLFTGYIMAVVRGGSGGLGRRPHVWRGEVIDLRPGGRGLASWWWRLRANLRNDKR